MTGDDERDDRRGHAWIAVVADTHGLLPQRVVDACVGAVHIIHAGDVGTAEVLERLSGVAPVTAVRGNRDRDSFGRGLPDEVIGEVLGLRFAVAHKRRDLRARHPDPRGEGLELLVYGDSHRAELRYRGHRPGEIPVLWLNPGTASAPLPHDPRPSMARVVVRDGLPDAVIRFFD
jgi:putative phosphoesterase